MQDTPPPAPFPKHPVDSATVLLLRDGAQGLEVFMVQRHEKSGGYGGAYVFPGGKVDAADARPELLAHRDQAPPALHAALDQAELAPQAAAGIYLAAAREVFEECGVLLAPGATVEIGQHFYDLLQRQQLQVDTRQLLPWSRWVTPPNSISSPTRRFDTRFFVARMPLAQTARHDNHEALESYWMGDIVVMAPQLMSLSHLASHASVASVLAEAAGRPPHVVRPHVTEVDGLRVMAYPGDLLNPDTHRVMPGTTRLVVRNGRAEPPQGFEGFFGPAWR
jgi:8-oxo-dGTP pyrophosphatase MutT (NUDIX family)